MCSIVKILLLAVVLQSHANAFVPAARKPSGEFGVVSTGSQPTTSDRSGWIAPSTRAVAPSSAVSLHESKDGSTPALCFSGGGFLAFSTQVAFVTGMLGRSIKDNSGIDTLDKLFERIDLIGSNSGGTWFSSELIYSSSFVDLVNSMANSEKDSDVEKTFREGWCEKFPTPELDEEWTEKIKDLTDTIWKAISEIIELPGIVAVGGKTVIRGLLEDFAETYLFVKGCYQEDGTLFWTDFVGQMLEATAGIGADVCLGDADRVNEWAKGKTWIINTSTGTPTTGTAFTLSEEEGKTLEYSLSENPATTSKTGPQTPSRFIVKPGTNEVPPSVINGAAFDDVTPLYTSDSLNTQGSKGGLNPVGNVADMRVVDVAAASSAVGGIIVSLRKDARKITDGLKLYPDVCFAPSLTGKQAFDKPKQLIKDLHNKGAEDIMSDLASYNLCPCNDGGWTDNTGILHAVAAGADEIYVFLNSREIMQDGEEVGVYGFSQFLGLFSNDSESSVQQYPIFSMTQEDAKAHRNNFTPIEKVTSLFDKSKFKSLAVGTYELTTIDQDIAGVKGGKKVVVHVFDMITSKFSISGTTTIAQLWNFNVYSELVGQMYEAIVAADNAPIVEKVLRNLKGEFVSLNK